MVIDPYGYEEDLSVSRDLECVFMISKQMDNGYWNSVHFVSEDKHDFDKSYPKFLHCEFTI